MAGTAADLLHVAAKEIGYVEGPKDNQTKYAPAVGHANFQPWCATFVVWCARQAGVKLPNESAYTPTSYQGFKNEGRAVPVDKMLPGDIAYFEWPGKGRIAHIAIFEKYGPGGSHICIEGNTNAAGSRTGGEVLRKVRKKGLVTHAGRPAFSAGGVALPSSAAPAASPLGGDVAKLVQQPGSPHVLVASATHVWHVKSKPVLDNVIGLGLVVNQKPEPIAAEVLDSLQWIGARPPGVGTGK